MTTRWYGVSDPSNMKNFTVNSYNLTHSGSWCVKPNTFTLIQELDLDILTENVVTHILITIFGIEDFQIKIII